MIHAEVFATLRYLVRRRLDMKRPLTFIDATHLTVRERHPYVKMGRLYECSVEAVFFDIPAEICKARNASRSRTVPDWVIDAMALRLVPPTIAEGFDSVTTYGP